MKAAADKGNKVTGDFYSSTIAPVNHRRGFRIRAMDVFILTVLILAK
jgi:hypothetical protein